LNYYKIISLVILSLLLGVMATLSSAEIYRWVDENGQVHFGDKPITGEYEVLEQVPSPVRPIEPKSKLETKKESAENSVETDTSVVDKPKGKGSQDANEPVEGTTEEKKSKDEKQAQPKEDKPKEEELTEEEKVEAARQKRIKDMDALSEELRVSREKRETKREKEKEELRSLREGCVKAMERVSYLQAELDHYVSLQPRRKIDRDPDDVPLDVKHERIAAELKIRRKYVKENCDNL